MGFVNEGYSGGGGRQFPSGTTILTIVLSILSLIGAVLIIANFGQISASIAIMAVNLLSAGIPLFAGIIALICLAAGIRRRRRRRYWDRY